MDSVRPNTSSYDTFLDRSTNMSNAARGILTERLTKEVDEYLEASITNDLESGFEGFPTIRKIFLKYNCIRPSEAICERMFSYAGMILTDKRLNMNPDFFEELLILHMNDWDFNDLMENYRTEEENSSRTRSNTIFQDVDLVNV